MKRILLLAVLLPLGLSAQTHKIAHKLRSGTSETLNHALVTGTLSNSNFGMAPMRTIRHAVLDSVIYIDEKTQIMVTSEKIEYTDDWRGYNNQLDPSQQENVNTKPKESICSIEQDKIWRPGRDTVKNHYLFSVQNVDTIKKILERDFYFQNDIEKVQFVGYPVIKKKQTRTKTVKEGMMDYLPIGLILLSAALTWAIQWGKRKYNEI